MHTTDGRASHAQTRGLSKIAAPGACQSTLPATSYFSRAANVSFIGVADWPARQHKVDDAEKHRQV
jgi:hypothetical protein